MSVSIREIAKEAGVGIAAVSLALRNLPGVSDKTRDTVLAVADSLGYRRDPVVARVASRRWKRSEQMPVIACVNQLKGYAFDLASSLCQRMGYSLEYYEIGSKLPPKRLGEILFNRGIEGVLLGKIADPNFVAEFPWAHFASVESTVNYTKMHTHTVRADVGRAMQSAIRIISQCNDGSIGVILWDEPDARDVDDMEGSYLRYQSHSNASPIPILWIDSAERARGVEKMRDWLLKYRPANVIVHNPSIYWMLQEVSGNAIPESLDLVSLHQPTVIAPKEIAHFRTMHDYTIEAAIELLDQELRSGRRGLPFPRKRILLESVWVPGKSLKGCGA